MPNIKIALVGGGSFAWTPRVVCNILGQKHLDGAQVVLFDINPDALDLTHRLALKYRDLAGSPTTFEKTTTRAEAFDGAAVVVVTISTGGLNAMQHDLEIPEKYGIYQTVGDTVGPGGLARALRNVPVFLDLARDMEARCPDAWMLNCSNPLCALTRVVNRETGIRALGLCHGVRGVAREFARFFEVDLDACAFVNTGIDHCAWFTHFIVNGRPARDLLIERGVEDWLALPPDQAVDDPTFGKLFSLRCGIALGLRLNALPAIGDRHMLEFFPTFLKGLDNVEKYGQVRTTTDGRRKNVSSARERLEGLLSGDAELKLTEGSDNVAGWIAALNGGPPLEDNLNAPNIGQVPQLPTDAIVETRGVLDATGSRPLVSPLPPQLEAIVRPHVLREELTLEAALEGSFDKALRALATDPLLGNGDDARPMLEELIAATKEWLPQF